MAYDDSKDECVAHFSGFRVGSHAQVMVRAMRYNGGELKLAIDRLVETRRGVATRRLGRVAQEEIAPLIAALKKAQESWPKDC